MKKLLKFEKENCPACTMVENFLNDNNVLAEKVNPFDNPNLAVKFEISSVPVTILLDEEGNEISRSRGFNPDELQELISKLI
ncbi:thioredoxin [Bacillus sp. Bva_UNVM-123]|uniref:thioredoxin family protein n=1 Tax=Bacillus sp. Bva_UNVM-123 TaxID=2829798 RepID=UPI00391F46C1